MEHQQHGTCICNDNYFIFGMIKRTTDIFLEEDKVYERQ